MLQRNTATGSNDNNVTTNAVKGFLPVAIVFAYWSLSPQPCIHKLPTLLAANADGLYPEISLNYKD
jgi:hypothetical protein